MKVARIYSMRHSWETCPGRRCSIWKPSSCGCALLNFVSYLCSVSEGYLWRREWNILSLSIKIRQGSSSCSVSIPAPFLCLPRFPFIILELNSKWWHIWKISQTWLIRGCICKEFQTNLRTHHPSAGNKERKEKTFQPVFSAMRCLQGKVWQPNAELVSIKRWMITGEKKKRKKKIRRIEFSGKESSRL